MAKNVREASCTERSMACTQKSLVLKLNITISKHLNNTDNYPSFWTFMNIKCSAMSSHNLRGFTIPGTLCLESLFCVIVCTVLCRQFCWFSRCLNCEKCYHQFTVWCKNIGFLLKWMWILAQYVYLWFHFYSFCDKCTCV